jgi:Golgi nucleoside diphosphatase
MCTSVMLLTSTTSSSCPSLWFFASLTASPLVPLVDYVQKLIDFAKAELTNAHNQWDKIPLFIRATAGMRVLPSAQREAVLAAVRAYLKDAKNNPFQFDDENFRVISGEEEGSYGWLTVNYLLNSITSDTGSYGALGTSNFNFAFESTVPSYSKVCHLTNTKHLY